MKNFKNQKSRLDFFYIVLLLLLVTTFIFSVISLIAIFVFDNPIQNIDRVKLVFSLLAPVGIMLSAGLASISVLKSINNTNELELNKLLRKSEETKKRLEFYLSDIIIIVRNGSITPSIDKMTKNIRILENIFKGIENDNEIISQYSVTDLNNILLRLRIIFIEIETKNLNQMFVELTQDIESFKQKYQLSLYEN